MSRTLLEGASGQTMNLDDYYADFRESIATTREFWKLERGQNFAEPGNASWEAFNRGDWRESMRLLEENRADVADYHREAAANGLRTHRVRIVEFPLSAYLHWELHALKIRDETGGPIRVLPAAEVRHLEDRAPLPEIYSMDDRKLFQAIYDENGVLANARRFTQVDVVRRCRDLIVDLWRIGEPLSAFFDREVAHLPPARPSGTVVEPGYLEIRGRPGPIRS